ncbi:hypothetical protein E3E14_16735 [Streptomyces sp. ICN441]|uniref:hypothetical protein n=1 Tax=Streptomyces sp. ICN441 TaxID=2558286 RepID=UPI00106CE577|nr:hypothetical protein [Streptomyces sp. ICN441]TFE49011.1 hypothetical protein E3E14_16735 [Streptomyces sp. ICN441]
METGTRPAAAVNAANPGWCHWHMGSSGTALLIQYGERSSGPPVALYACAPCREQRRLVPLGSRS